MIAEDSLIVGKYYPALDGLRGLAVLMVIFFHSSTFAHDMSGIQLFSAMHCYYIFTLLGETGVDLFFILSGFLITGILIDTRNVKNPLKTFYIRRALRLLPLYYVVLFIVLMCSAFLSNDSGIGLKILMHFLYLQNYLTEYNFDTFMYFNHTWSLAVEEQFYLFWPVFFLFVYRKSPQKALLLCVTLIFVSLLCRGALAGLGHEKLAYTALFSRMDELCMGAFLSICFVQYRDILNKYADILPYIMLSMCLLLIGSFILYWATIPPRTIMINSGLVYCAIFYSSLLSYILLSPDTSYVKRVFCIRSLRYIGRISYGLYIFHVPAMMMTGVYISDYKLGYVMNHLCILLVGGTLSFIVAFLSYKYVERPILKLKNKYAYEA